MVLISMIVIVAQCVRTQSITLYALNTCYFSLEKQGSDVGQGGHAGQGPGQQVAAGRWIGSCLPPFQLLAQRKHLIRCDRIT